MIDLTPLDVRKKRGDFGRGLRGYDPGEVDTFLDLVAERLEELVKENLRLRERAERLSEQVEAQDSRERAVQEALVTAQQIREDVREQARREGDLIRREAEGEARRIIREAEQRVVERRQALEEMERRRLRFLKSFRGLLERELDGVEVEEAREPLEDAEVDLELGGSLPGGRERAGSLESGGGGERLSIPAQDPVHELAAAAEEGWAEREASRSDVEPSEDATGLPPGLAMPPAGPGGTDPDDAPEDIWSGEPKGGEREGDR